MKELSIGDIDIIGGKIVRCEEKVSGLYTACNEVSLSSLTAEREQICKGCQKDIYCDKYGCADTADIDRQIAKVKELMK